ncbi:MAG: hypothetical protein IPK70_01985 [Flavobacteriales bacterium]|jgi:uncharacterized membrane protein HdeD (DUF308 family)|nr:hypothetical protein [Flavobacteriales bacterium]
MENPLTPEQSLKIIESMIGQAKRSFSRFSFYFLLWGVLLTGAMLATYLLADLDPAIRHGMPWGVAGIGGGIISSIHGARQGRQEPVSNPMDGVIGWLWSSFVITMIITIVVSVLDNRDPGAMVTLLTGIPTFMTGQILRFRPLIFGGLLFWAAGIAMHFTDQAGLLTALYCGAMGLGYIIPGILLKRQEDGLRAA